MEGSGYGLSGGQRGDSGFHCLSCAPPLVCVYVFIYVHLCVHMHVHVEAREQISDVFFIFSET